MRFAIIEDGVVANIAIADAPLADNWLEIEGMADIGWTYNGVSFAPLPVDLTALAASAREKRNVLLQQSDWTQVADAPVDQSAWAVYRQALRDITAQAGFPETINWPVAPE